MGGLLPEDLEPYVPQTSTVEAEAPAPAVAVEPARPVNPAVVAATGATVATNTVPANGPT